MPICRQGYADRVDRSHHVKAVILAGGAGTRLMEETTTVPKPMVEIGGMPILWHIMKGYSHHGVNEFVILAGYKGDQIKNFFANYYLRNCDVTFDLANGDTTIHNSISEPWKVTIVDTGLQTMTGGRLLRARRYLESQRFFLTYGDGVCDVDVRALLAFHERKGVTATMTAVPSDSRYGHPSIQEDGLVDGFAEKPSTTRDLINAGFFVLEPSIFDYLRDGDQSVLERNPLETLAKEGKLAAFHHTGYWKCMDTLRDKVALEAEWQGGAAPWKLWGTS
jgi:glucose-1-phosphate cytidylyltransferase